MKKPIILMPLVASLIVSLAEQAKAQGSFMQATDPNFGANSLLVDMSTGLIWLNLNYTSGLSYDQVLAQSGPGGEFAGFSYASVQQVYSLFADADIPGPGVYPMSSPVQQSIAGFLPMIAGSVDDQNGRPAAMGITGSTTDGLQASVAIYMVGLNGAAGYNVGSGASFNPAEGSAPEGNWLVATVMPIPEPAAWQLALLGGLLGLGVSRKEWRSYGAWES
jgi:hypothetical protein